MLKAVMAMIQAVAAPLPPIDAWSVSQADGMCILSRPFGDRASPVVLAIRQTPLDDDGAELFIIDAKPGSSYAPRGKVRVALSPSDIAEEADFQRGKMADGKRRFTTFSIAAATMSALPRSTEVNVTADKEARWRFPLATINAARGVLRQCNDAVLTRWGIDPGEQDRIATPAVRRATAPRAWVDHYPLEAIRRNEQGTSTAAWRVDEKGEIADCRIVETSGHASLDKATCATLRSLGGYTPALGRDGSPVASWKTNRVVWNLGRR